MDAFAYIYSCLLFPVALANRKLFPFNQRYLESEGPKSLSLLGNSVAFVGESVGYVVLHWRVSWTEIPEVAVLRFDVLNS